MSLYSLSGAFCIALGLDIVCWGFVQSVWALYNLSVALQSLSGLCRVCRGFVKSVGALRSLIITLHWALLHTLLYEYAFLYIKYLILYVEHVIVYAIHLILTSKFQFSPKMLPSSLGYSLRERTCFSNFSFSTNSAEPLYQNVRIDHKIILTFLEIGEKYCKT